MWFARVGKDGVVVEEIKNKVGKVELFFFFLDGGKWTDAVRTYAHNRQNNNNNNSTLSSLSVMLKSKGIQGIHFC